MEGLALVGGYLEGFGGNHFHLLGKGFYCQNKIHCLKASLDGPMDHVQVFFLKKKYCTLPHYQSPPPLKTSCNGKYSLMKIIKSLNFGWRAL
jgi:hypothetical protein